MLVYSETTQRTYDDNEMVFYKNQVQSAWMLSHPECILYDIFEINGKLCYVFSKEQHRQWIGEWHERQRDNQGDRYER